MKTLLKRWGLKYSDENAEIIFENHIKELQKRYDEKLQLGIELDEQTLQSLDQKFLDIAQEVVEYLKVESIQDLEVEKFLIATHIMMMEENNE